MLRRQGADYGGGRDEGVLGDGISAARRLCGCRIQGVPQENDAGMTDDSPNQGTVRGDVFVSYASQDAAVANSVVEVLERHGIKCWFAPRDVNPGSQYADEIVGAINDAKVFVLVLSEHAIASPHVGREIERAASKRRRIVALRTDAAVLTRSFEYFLSESQWIDVAALGMSGALTKLAQSVGQGVAPASWVSPGLGVDAENPADRKRKPSYLTIQRVVAAAVFLVAAAVVVGVVFRYWPSKQGGEQAPTVAAVSDKSIAVLPFADMSQKRDQEYFGDGMAEEILDLLAKIPGLTVIGRTSSFAFKGKNEDLRKIGAELNAAYVLEGSVRSSGDQVRITAQLINTRTGAHEWSETYDRPIGDVLKLQDAIAAAVVRELQLTVAPEDLNSQSTVKSAESYDLYLRGRHAADRTDREGFDGAVVLFQRALDRDPTFAGAAAALSITQSNQVMVGSLAPAAGFEQARRAATTALKLDPNNVRALVGMALIHIFYDWDWAGAEQVLQKAATFAPGNVDVLSGESILSATLGRWDDALRQSKAAVAQDPLDAGLLQFLSSTHEARGNLREAEAVMRRAMDIRPTYAYGHYNLGLIFLERGDHDGALREMQQETIDDGKQQGLALADFALGKKAEADAALAVLIKEQADGNALDIAQVYAFRGQTDEAMQWLDRAHAQKDPWLFQIKGSWLMKGLEADPRYQAFLKKMNLPE
jgi:TolB-like protein/predicted Zn-dependent protease